MLFVKYIVVLCYEYMMILFRNQHDSDIVVICIAP